MLLWGTTERAALFPLLLLVGARQVGALCKYGLFGSRWQPLVQLPHTEGYWNT